MVTLKIEVGGELYEIVLPQSDYLQRRFGTFHRDYGFDKLKRENWDNSQFFDYQSRQVFTIQVGSKKRNVQTKKPLSKAEEKQIFAEIADNHRFSSSEEIEQMAKAACKAAQQTEKKPFRMKFYLTVCAYFLDGEWRFVTRYKSSDIEQSFKHKLCQTVKTHYIYTDEKLGVEEVNESVFDKLM